MQRSLVAQSLGDRRSRSRARIPLKMTTNYYWDVASDVIAWVTRAHSDYQQNAVNKGKLIDLQQRLAKMGRVDNAFLFYIYIKNKYGGVAASQQGQAARRRCWGFPVPCA